MNTALEYLRENRLPHIWCPGCGHGTIMGAVVRAIARLHLDKNKVVIVSGIGCSSRAPGYMDFDTLHTTHGRALAFATGIKHARPDLKVIVMTGDGDATAIGGNHFIHTARRNIGITTIVMNNNIYGMTSGQVSPMTPKGSLGTTAPYGNIDRSFDLVQLAAAAGATYVGRATTYHVPLLIDLIEHALQNDGFSVVEAMTPCPTYYGRKNKLGGAVELLTMLKENAVNIKAASALSEDKLKDKFLIGEFVNKAEPEFTSEYTKMVQQVQRKFDTFQGGLRECERNSD